MAKDIDLSPFYAQDREEERRINGVKFILQEPKDSDDVINMMLSGNDRAKALKRLCLAVVKEPDLSAEWDKFGYGGKMTIISEVVSFLGLSEDFLSP
jgi:hypothetical protein